MKKELSLETILERKADIPSTVIDGEVGLMNITTGKYFALNSVGSDIWNLLEKPMSLHDLIQALLKEYEIDGETCEKEIRPFAERLVDEGIVIAKE